jgi:hypothetical protein
LLHVSPDADRRGGFGAALRNHREQTRLSPSAASSHQTMRRSRWCSAWIYFSGVRTFRGSVGKSTSFFRVKRLGAIRHDHCRRCKVPYFHPIMQIVLFEWASIKTGLM